MTKSQVNRKYYENHPELRLKNKLQQRQNRIITKNQLTVVRPQSLGFESVSLCISIVLVLLSTGILMHEMVQFYGGSAVGYGIAITIELAIASFSIMVFKSFFKNFLVKSFLIIVCGYNLFCLSSKSWNSTVALAGSNQNNVEIIGSLKKQIQEKSEQKRLLIEKGWFGAVRRLDAHIDALHLELKQELRSQSLSEKTEVAWLKTVLQIMLRVILIVINIIAASKAKESFVIFQNHYYQNRSKNKPNASIARGHKIIKLVPNTQWRSYFEAFFEVFSNRFPRYGSVHGQGY
jgi:hypothetical protein